MSWSTIVLPGDHSSVRTSSANAPPTMPSFEGQLKEREVQAIIAFIKSLKK